MYKPKQEFFKNIYMVGAINIFSSTALAQQAEDYNIMRTERPAQIYKEPQQRQLLVSVTPPVGYKSWLGIVLNTTPVVIEIPLHEQIGLRVEPSIIYYLSRFQSYSVFCTLPFYLEKSDRQKPYHGFYAGPYIAWGERLRPESTSRLGGGVEVGYSWAYDNSMQFSLGLMRSTQGMAGLSIALGKWF